MTNAANTPSATAGLPSSPASGSTLCPFCKENPQPADRSTCHECEQELNANKECED